MDEEDYLQQLRRMMSDIEERSDMLSDNEYLTMMNNCMQSYLIYRNETCTCTEDSFECYRYPRLLQNCRHKDTILQQAPLLTILIPGGQIPADFRLQMEVTYEPYDNDLLVITLRYLLNISLESDFIFDRIVCAISIFHLVFKHHGILEKSPKLREVVFRKLNEFQTSEETLIILENFDFSVLGLSGNPIPIWGGEARFPPYPPMPIPAEMSGVQTSSFAEMSGVQTSSFAEMSEAQTSSFAEMSGAKTSSFAEMSEAQTSSFAEMSEAKTSSFAEMSEAQTSSFAEMSEAKTSSFA